MFKFTKKWEIVWNGHHIVVHNWWTLLMASGEELWIDGVLIQQERGLVQVSRELMGEIRAVDKNYQVRVHLGSVDFGFRVGCQIFVDEELVGGDINKKFFT